jgi:drug/metabolite transporter (DMT)-like permease
MRFLSVIYLLVTTLLVFAGLCRLTMLDGQEFTNTLGCLACALAALLVSLWAARDPRLAQQLRPFWRLSAVLLTLLAAGLAASLPHRRNIDMERVFRAVHERFERDLRR